MKQAGNDHIKAANALNAMKRWQSANAANMRSAAALYRAVAGRAAVFSGVLLVAPYALLIFLTMKAVGFDMGRGLQLMLGVGYAGDWSNMIVGRLQALSSLSSLISLATDLFLLPCACAAFAFIFSTRWQGLALTLDDTWRRIKPLVLRIVTAGIAVMLLSNFAQMIASLVVGLLSMIGGLLSFIPILGPIVNGIIYVISLLVNLALALLSVAVLMFTMLTMAGENGARGQLFTGTLRVMWGGRRDVLPSLLWLLLVGAALIIAGALLYGALFALSGATAASIIMIMALALIACAAIPLACAFITVIYMHEYERQGGHTYIYARHE